MFIKTRTRAIILSITIASVYFAFRGVDFLELLEVNFEFDFIKLFIVALIMYVGLLWVLNFRIRGERFITIMLFPSMAVFILTLYAELLINSVLGSINQVVTEIFASFVVGFMSYILILTANILNIGQIEKIPLTQAGRAAHYVLTLLSNYLFLSIIFSNSLPIFVKLLSTFTVTYLFSSISLSTLEITKKERFLSSLGISLCMLVFSIVIAIWPINSEYIALFLSLVFYMLLGLALEVREVLSNRIWLEYTFLYFIIIIILMIVSEWGINGRLL